MANYVKVAEVTDLQPGQARAITVEGAEIALYNMGGEYHASAGQCPHAGGPLGEGDLNGCVVTCPWHGWQWDVRTGECANNPMIPRHLKVYEVKAEAGGVIVGLD